MTTILAPAELLSAIAFATDGGDPDLAPGTHLRIYAGLGPSFPLTPFTVFRLASTRAEPRRLHWADRRGQAAAEGNLALHGELLATLITGDSERRHTVRAELLPQGGRLHQASLLDARGRVTAERRDAPWLFAAPRLQTLRLRGNAAQLALRTRVVDPEDFAGQRRGELAAVLGLPVPGAHRWYLGLHERRDALRRVRDGAPRRLGPADRPDGPFDPLDPDDELARVEAFLRELRSAGGLEAQLRRLVDDAAAPPWAQVDLQQLEPARGPRQYVHQPRQALVQMAAADPGLARFLGFSARLDELPDEEGGGRGWDTLAVVGLIAFDARAHARMGVDVAMLLRQAAPGAAALLQRHVDALESMAGRALGADIDALQRRTREQGWVAEPFVAFAAAVPPWDAPALPPPQVIQRQWHAPDGDEPSRHHRAGFAFPAMPMASLAALGRRDDDGLWRSSHAPLDVAPRQPAERATTMLFGHEVESFARQRELALPLLQAECAGLLADHHIPAGAPVRYRAWALDAFGRAGEPAEFEVEAPPRPAPPQPVLRFSVRLSAPEAADEGPRSPGVLSLRVAVPQAAPAEPFAAADEDLLAAATRVPRLDEMAAGSLPLAALELSLDGGPALLVDLLQPGFSTVDLDLPALPPQGRGQWTLTGRYRDTAGRWSPPANEGVTATDARAPRAVPSGIGLFWTSMPGPSPEVELRLRWPAPAGARHRVYLTDGEGLGLQPADLGPLPAGTVPSRGTVGAVGCRKLLDGGVAPREAFRLLTEPPLQAGPDGFAQLHARLPRSLATVQFLRIVPLGPGGAEPPFDGCGLVPVAVPDGRRPAPPRLQGRVDEASGAALLTIIADGFDLAALRRDEPGLFEPGAAGAEPPRFRLRRAAAGVADPLYARVISEGPLQPVEAGGGTVFAAQVTDDGGGAGLAPFVRYAYWAEVVLPPERRVPAGVQLLQPPGGAEPLDPAGAQDHARPHSLPSAPLLLVHLPPQAPAAPEPARLALGRGVDELGRAVVDIELADAPRAPTLAIDRYRLAVWTQWPQAAITAIANANGEPLGDGWPVVEDGGFSTVLTPPPGVDANAPLKLRVALVDPAGRVGVVGSEVNLA